MNPTETTGIMDGLQHIPAGQTIPSSVHGVSVSIPDIASVVGFESHDDRTLRRIRRGYPRFRVHPYARRVAGMTRDHLDATGALADLGYRCASVEMTRSAQSAARAAAYAGLPPAAVVGAYGVSGVAIPGGRDGGGHVREFVQRTGCHLSSREAEDVLLREGVIVSRQPERTRPDDPERRIADVLASAYGVGDPHFVSLHNSGMNAVYAAISTLAELQARRGRRLWLQLGWIFFDTAKLFERGIVEADHRLLPDPFDVDRLAQVVAAHAGEIAGIVAEVPSNPLLQTPDLPALREIADRAGCAVVIDATIGTPYNVDVLEYADVACESLTKYATGSADVLMGAAVVNPASPFAQPLDDGLRRRGDRPYHRDAARVAERVAGYESRMAQVNANAMVLAEFFHKQPAVRRVHWAYEPRSEANFRKVERHPEAPGGLLMLDLDVPVESVYDHLAVAKGPSFGAEFTMAAPQVFVAHFDLLSDPGGRAVLGAHGLHRDMLRVSVGTEDIDRITATFEEAFHHAR